MANRNIERAVRVALFAAGAASVGAYSAAALAQEQEIEQIVVTGSRIPQPNLEGTSPVSVISSKEVTLQGVTQVEDLINNLPQAFADQGGGTSNGASGTATVDLRGLGADRTLVLQNGRRLPAGSVQTVAPDLNQIPAPLIERVEVLTGGAGAVYGSDAVAGVVNFILKDNFEGVQLDANTTFYNHKNSNSVGDVVRARGFETPGTYINSDGDTYELSLLMGSNFADDRGNATLFVGYRNIDALKQSERDFSACALGSSGMNFQCLGSGTSFPGRFIDLNSGADWSINPENGDVRPYSGARDSFNYNPYNYYQRPDERYSIAAFGHYDVNDSATVYTELNFMDDDTVAQIAPSGLFGLITPISCSNPLLTAQWVDSICTQNGLGPDDDADMFIFRRNVEGGGRQSQLRHTSYRGVIGLKGGIGENWDYDVFGQYGTVIYKQVYANDFSRVRSARAMDVVADPDTGAPVCRSVLDGTDPNCVPYDIWNINVTPEALAYMQTPGFFTGETEQRVAQAAVSSDLGAAYGIQLPTANHGVGIAFGVEYREESIDSESDVAFSTNDLFGQGGATIGTHGTFNVVDYFTEVRVPLIEEMFLADSLTLNGSYRYSDYSTDVSTDTYGIGLDWAPVSGFRFRGSYQVAVRAPNIIELYQAQGTNLFGYRDPCGTDSNTGEGPTATLEQCQRTGVTAAQYGSTLLVSPAGQYNYLQGGNPDLEPEESDSYTVGFVFTPSFLDGFSMTLDYFNIKVEDVISVLNPATSMTQCLQTGNATFCDLIQRDQLGTIWALPEGSVTATNINLSNWETSGFDIDMNYGVGIGSMGSLSFNFMGTLLDTMEFEDIPGLGKYDCVGLWGFTCGDPNPEWRHRFRATWVTPWNLDLSLSWRHFDSVDVDASDSNPLLAGDYEPIDRSLDAQDYLDIAASYTFLENYEVRLGINNFTDEDPPVTAVTDPSFNGNGNTFPNTYDSLGRYVFMGITAKF